MVSRDGRSVVDDGVNLYAQWFVIYAATQYAEVRGTQGPGVFSCPCDRELRRRLRPCGLGAK